MVEEGRTLGPVPNGDRERRADLLAVGFLALIVTLFFADILFGASRFYTRDLLRFYGPTKSVIREIVLGGEFPWWNPYYSAGQPMAANPEYEIFYPPQWLNFLPDFALGYRLHILFHIYLITISMYVLLRSFRLGVVGSLFGAISWGLGGVVISVITLLPTLFTAAWMPLLFLFVRRVTDRFRWRQAAAAGLVGGVQILAGDPAVLVATWLVIGAYAAWKTWRDRRLDKALWQTHGVVLLLFFWCVAVGSVQLIPAIDHAGATKRAAGLDYDDVTGWSFPPARLLEMVQPYVFGYLDDDGRNAWWGRSLYPQRHGPFILRIYEGALVIPLLLAGVWTRGTRRLEMLLLVTPFFLIALGTHFIVVPWLFGLGIPVPLRFPERFMVTVIFVAIVYSSSILDRIARGDRVLLRRAIITCAALAGIVALATLLTRSQAYESWFLTFWSTEKSRFGERMVFLSRRGWAFALVPIALSTLTLIAIRLRPSSSRLWHTSILAILVLELLTTSFDTAPRTTPEVFDPPPVATRLEPNRDRFRIFHHMDWYEDTMWAAGYMKTGKGAIWAERNGMFPMLPAAWGFRTVLERDYDLTLLLPTTDLVESMRTLEGEGRKGWERFFLPISNVGYVAVPRPLAQELRRVDGRLWELEPADFIEVPTLPRYYFATAMRRVRNKGDFIRQLRTEIPDPRTAFVAVEPFQPARGRVLSVDEHSSSISIHTTSEGTSFLVLSITPQKYWQATIDGIQATLHVTNIGYQGLVVPAGEHRIALTYSNSLTIGFGIVSLLALSAAALIMSGGVAISSSMLPSRRSQSPRPRRPSSSREPDPGLPPEDPSV